MKELGASTTTQPDSEFRIYDEIRRLEQELSDARRSVGSISSLKSEAQALEKQRSSWSDALDRLKKLDCASPTAAEDARELRGQIQRVFRRRISLELALDQLELLDPPDLPSTSVPNLCNALKKLSGEEDQKKAKSYFDAIEKLIQQEEKLNATLKDDLNRLIAMLEVRRDKLQEKLTATSSANKLSAYLWVVIGAIGATCISFLLIISRFPEKLQIEWVASGQVIQFVTVMILLSAILVLGLANVLRENTLGTLLGGIAGYVLAQGVGRAAAREATRVASPEAKHNN